MRFVAQPYEQFVDNLLTALTGGMVREEHQFTGAEETYSMASPGALPISIKVFGQKGDRFMLFEGGIDYIFDTTQEVIVWKPEGKLPDDRSFFYINYYLKEGKRRLTDRNPGSVTATLAEAFAREFAVLHKQMEMIYRSAFVDLATDVSLDHVAALLDINRKDARFAGGEVLFKRSTPAQGDITIPADTLISTDEGQNFETSDRRTLRKGQLSVIVPIRAQVEGPAGRVAAGSIKKINRPILGIESVINEEATFFATAKETDEELRQRIKGTLERAGKSTLNAIKFGLIEEISEITENNIQITEHADMPGLVEVKLGLESKGDANLVRRIEQSIFNSKAAGIRVVHNLSTRTKTENIRKPEINRPELVHEETTHPVKERIGKQAPLHLPQEILTKMPEGMFPLRAEVFLRLTESNLSASEKEKIEDDVRTRVMDYIEAIPMGADLIYNKLLGHIVQSEEILDLILRIGPAPVGNFYTSNISTDGRKAKIDIHDVFVRLIEESVFIDIKVSLESKKSDASVDVTDDLYNAVEDSIHSILTVAQDKFSKIELKSAINGAVQQIDSRLQFIAGDFIIINAEYEETGRLLNNTDEVSLEENQVPELRDLNIEIKGVLDV